MSNRTRQAEILLVEDNPGDVRLTQEALRERGLVAHLGVARDGVEALDYLRQTGAFAGAARPDLVLLDLNLPRKSGREVLQAVKEDADLRAIPVVVLSTSDAARDIDEAYALHANCYIRKPVDLDGFLTVMRSIEEFWLETANLPNAS